VTPYLILEKALAVLRERGWCKGGLTNRHGHVCVVGAVNVAARGEPGLFAAEPIIAIVDKVAAKRTARDGFRPSSTFNDLSTTTQADVEQLLLDAMSLALSEEGA
jgi:hypothetical protein